MGFTLKVKKDKESLREAGGAYIGTSGVYPVVINFLSLEETNNGATVFNMNIKYNDNDQVIYGSTVQNTNGEENKIGMSLLNKLFVIAGMAEGEEPVVQNEVHRVGRDNEEKQFQVIQNLTGLELQLQVKEIFTVYKGNIQRSLDPYNFFRKDGATAQEIASIEEGGETEEGTQLKKTLAKEATCKPLYKANKGTNEAAPTEKDIEHWLANRGKDKVMSAANTAKGPGNLFS